MWPSGSRVMKTVKLHQYISNTWKILLSKIKNIYITNINRKHQWLLYRLIGRTGKVVIGRTGKVVTLAVYKYLKVVACNAVYIQLVSYCAADHGRIRLLRFSRSEIQSKLKNRRVIRNMLGKKTHAIFIFFSSIVMESLLSIFAWVVQNFRKIMEREICFLCIMFCVGVSCNRKFGHVVTYKNIWVDLLTSSVFIYSSVFILPVINKRVCFSYCDIPIA